MVTQFGRNKKRQRILLIVLIVIIIITVLVWLFGFSKPKRSAILVVPPVLVKEIKINFELFKDPRLIELRPFQEIPPFGREPGRENPFLSY